MIHKLRTWLAPYLADLRGGSSTGAVLARGAATSLIARVTGTGMIFGVHVLLARLLGATSYGPYVYVLSWVNILALVSKLGLDTVSLRFVAQYRGTEDWGRLRGFLLQSRRVALLASAAVALLAAGAAYLLRARLEGSQLTVFWLGCLLLPVFVRLELHGAALRAFKRIASSELPFQIVRPALVAALVGGTFLLSQRPPSAPAAMAATVAANLGALALAAVLLHRAIPAAVRGAEPAGSTAEWLRVALPLLLLSGASLVLSQTDILMVGALLDTTRAGIYSAASRLASLLAFGLIAVNTIAAPMIAELHATEQRRRLQRLLTLAAWASLAFALPTTLLMVAAGRPLLGLFGSEFLDGYRPLVILALGQLVNSLCGSVGFVLTMTGHQRQAALIMGSTAVLNIGLNLLLIPRLGLAGAALATAFSTVLWNLLMVGYVLRRHRLNPTALRPGL